jgi:UDP-N-acetylglucosamine transferase subunit ALG13
MQNLSAFYNGYSHFWITAKNAQTENSLEGENAHYLRLGHFKKPWTYLFQLPTCLEIFIKERPTHLVSTGSGRIAFLPVFLAFVMRAEIIHIETFSHVNKLTKLGRLVSKLGIPIYSQWRSSDSPKIIYIGPIMTKERNPDSRDKREEHVFLSLGTRMEPFPRIIRAVEALIREGLIKERVVVQAGHTKYRSRLMEIFNFCPPKVIDDLVRNAAYVVTQESAGIGTKCLKFNTRFIVMPRDYAFGELPARSDMNEDLHFRLQEMGFTSVVKGIEDLRQAVRAVRDLKVGFSFDNSLALSKLREQMGHGRHG